MAEAARPRTRVLPGLLEAAAGAASKQQRSQRRREQRNADVDLLHEEITLFESSSLAHQLEPQRDPLRFGDPSVPLTCAEALPAPSDHTDVDASFAPSSLGSALDDRSAPSCSASAFGEIDCRPGKTGPRSPPERSRAAGASAGGRGRATTTTLATRVSQTTP